MRYAISGCSNNEETTSIYHNDEKGVYILADATKGGKRGHVAVAAVLEAFTMLEELPENTSMEQFQLAIDEGIALAQKYMERNIREHVRAGKLAGVVDTKHRELHGGETFSDAETARMKGVAMEHVVQQELASIGCTALVALVTEQRLFVANVAGDSRFEVLKHGENGKVELETITLDHSFLWLRMHGKLPPGTLDKEKAFAFQRKLDHARTEAELQEHEILKEAWKMKDIKGQALTVTASPEVDFYDIELKPVISWQMYTHGVIEHTARAQRKQELIDAEQIGIPPVTVVKTILGLADTCESCHMGMLYARKIASE